MSLRYDGCEAVGVIKLYARTPIQITDMFMQMARTCGCGIQACHIEVSSQLTTVQLPHLAAEVP